MSHIEIEACEMHKIGQFFINVKHHPPGNVVEYLPVEFKIFQDGEYYKAIPFRDFDKKIIMDLPSELSFQIKNWKKFNYQHSHEEIIEDIVDKLIYMNLVEAHLQRLRKENK